jgi:membrane-associated HD superfamily phosphohydrolase
MWLAEFGDPTIICRPLIVLLSDTIWSRVAFMTFLGNESWFLISLVFFIITQYILKYEAHSNDIMFGCRAVMYGVSMTQVLHQKSQCNVAGCQVLQWVAATLARCCQGGV